MACFALQHQAIAWNIVDSSLHDDVIKWEHFRVTGSLCGKFTGDRRIARTKASDAELWCFLWSEPEETIERLADAGHHAHYDVIVMSKVQWQSSAGNFTRDTSAINHQNQLQDHLCKILFKSPRGQWFHVSSAHLWSILVYALLYRVALDRAITTPDVTFSIF